MLVLGVRKKKKLRFLTILIRFTKIHTQCNSKESNFIYFCFWWIFLVFQKLFDKLTLFQSEVHSTKTAWSFRKLLKYWNRKKNHFFLFTMKSAFLHMQFQTKCKIFILPTFLQKYLIKTSCRFLCLNRLSLNLNWLILPSCTSNIELRSQIFLCVNNIPSSEIYSRRDSEYQKEM